MWKRKSCRGLKLSPSSLPSQAAPLSPPQPLAPWHGNSARHKDSEKVKKLLPDAPLTHTTESPIPQHPGCCCHTEGRSRSPAHPTVPQHLTYKSGSCEPRARGRKEERDSLSWEWRSSFPSESLSQWLTQATRQGAARRMGRCRPFAVPGHSITL